MDIIPTQHQKAALEWSIYNTENPIETLIATQRTGFLNCPYPDSMKDSNKINRKEAKIVAQLIQAIYNLSLLNNLSFNPQKQIGIIVPFRNQITSIMNELASCSIPNLEMINIDTVERYQGSQRDIIIYCTTISQPYQLAILSDPIEIDGLLIDRKLNVAVTRARKQLFVIGNGRLLESQPIYKKLIEHLTKSR